MSSAQLGGWRVERKRKKSSGEIFFPSFFFRYRPRGGGEESQMFFLDTKSSLARATGLGFLLSISRHVSKGYRAQRKLFTITKLIDKEVHSISNYL